MFDARLTFLSTGALALGVLLAACGSDDTSPGDNGNGGPGNGTMGDGTITGSVIEQHTQVVLGNAEVTAFDLEGNSLGATTTAADGTFMIGGLPTGNPVVLRGTAAGHSGLAQIFGVPDSDFSLALPTLETVEMFAMDGAVTRRPELGIVIIVFDSTNTAGGEAASISAMSEVSTVVTAEDRAIVGDTLPAMSTSSAVNFLNVATGPATLAVTSPPGVTCTVPLEQFVVFANTVTDITVQCL